MPQVFLVSITHQIHCSCGCTWEGFTKFNCWIIVFCCQIVVEMHSKKNFAHLLGTRTQDLLNSIKTQHDFRVRLTTIPSWGSPSTYGDVVSPAATGVGARQLARRGERLSQTPCLKGGRRRGKRERILNRCASTKYVNWRYICLTIPHSVLELDGFVHRPAHPSALDLESSTTWHGNIVSWQLCGPGLCIEALVYDWSTGGTMCTEFFFLYLLQSYSGAKTCRWLAWRPPPSSVRSVCNTSTSTTFSPSSVQWGFTLWLVHRWVEWYVVQLRIIFWNIRNLFHFIIN